MIQVPLKNGASATLEGIFTPTYEGDVQAPRLLLTLNKIQSPLHYLSVKQNDIDLL